MSGEKRAAIDMDAIGDKPLGELSAADFLAALDAGGMSLHHLAVWPEKKKVELWTEPEDFGRVRVGDLVNVIRGEKKKVERELPPGFDSGFFDSARYSALLDRIAREVESRLVGRMLPQDPLPWRPAEIDELADRISRDVEARLRRR
jgi:hypothetical protein